MKKGKGEITKSKCLENSKKGSMQSQRTNEQWRNMIKIIFEKNEEESEGNRSK